MLKYALLIGLSLTQGLASAQIHSQLWGEAGELFDPAGRLPDFSYAGYRFGDEAIPEDDPVTSVTEYGADGSDDLDDTDAFKAAIGDVEAGVILIPAGRYLISDIIWIRKPNIVLRGEGTGETILHITKTLEDVRPNMGATTSGKPTSNYSWSGGFIWAKGSYGSSDRIAISAPADRGDRVLRVEEPEQFCIGDRVLIEQRDNDSKRLLQHLYANDPGDTRKLNGDLRPMMVASIESIDGDIITLNRPLRWQVRPDWTPTLRSFSPNVHDVGVESLTIHFDPVPYKGHFSELGRNAIAFNGSSDCWVRNVRTVNCDSAVFFTGVQGTIDGLVVDSDRKPSLGVQGHHGVTLGLDNILTNFTFNTHYIHDITMTRLSAGNVVKNGSGTNLSLDHHKRANHANLYCNIDAGDGRDLWRCGGGASLGKHAGAWTTFWGIQTSRQINWPRASFGPSLMNLVGIRSEQEEVLDPVGKWFEMIDPEQLEPRDLHQAQLDRRRTGTD